jgi:sugar phosphate isomerase/epimerase
MEFEKFGGYRIGSNIPIKQGAVWENVARVARWGAPVIELNTNAERLGSQALSVIKQIAKANDIVYTWHVPPSAQESGELAIPNDPNQNEFARRIMERAIKSAAEVGARHITFHATLSAPKPAKDTLYVYDVQKEQVGMQRIVKGLNKEDTINLLDDSARAQLRTQVQSLKNNQKIISNMVKTADTIERLGVRDENAYQMAYLIAEASRYGQVVRVSPEDLSTWSRIQEKSLRMQPLTPDEKRVVKRYSKEVRDNVRNFEISINSQLTTLTPFLDEPHLIRDGEDVMKDNVAKNISMLDKDALRTAVKSGISLGFENLPGNQIFSTPEELNDLRERTINALVKSKKLTRKEAEQLIGFTYDFAHAHSTKYFDIAGKKFTSHKDFIERLKGPIKHVHATDSIGAVDSHLPLGQGQITKEEFGKIKEALERSGFKGTAVHELGASEIPALYASSMEWVEGGYFTHGVPTTHAWGPSYIAAAMNDPLMLEKDKGYFYESFVDLF